MNYIKTHISSFLMILAEILIGILLLTNPEGLTRTVIILFGVVLLAVGIASLIQYLRDKRAGIQGVLPLLTASAALIAGAIFTFGSSVIISLIAAVAIFYGLVLILSGVYKIHAYLLAKDAQLPVSALTIIGGALGILLGVIVVLYPKTALLSVWRITGIMLLVEAVLDIASLIWPVK